MSNRRLWVFWLVAGAPGFVAIHTLWGFWLAMLWALVLSLVVLPLEPTSRTEKYRQGF